MLTYCTSCLLIVAGYITCAVWQGLGKMDTSMESRKAFPFLPPELWIEIGLYLSPWENQAAAQVFDFQLKAYDSVWTTVFKDNEWLEYATSLFLPPDSYSNPVLIGKDLDLLTKKGQRTRRPRLFLTVKDLYGDLQNEKEMLQRCLRGNLGALPKSESRLDNLVFPATTLELEQVFLEVPTFAMGECRGDDFSYLFKYGGRSPLETRYCYYNDPKKTVRTLRSEGVRGIGGQITKRDYLTPIFLLDLVNPIANPSMASCSQQFIFRTFKGFSHRSGEKVFPLLKPIIRSDETVLDTEYEGWIIPEEHYKALWLDKKVKGQLWSDCAIEWHNGYFQTGYPDGQERSILYAVPPLLLRSGEAVRRHPSIFD